MNRLRLCCNDQIHNLWVLSIVDYMHASTSLTGIASANVAKHLFCLQIVDSVVAAIILGETCIPTTITHATELVVLFAIRHLKHILFILLTWVTKNLVNVDLTRFAF